MSSNQQSNMKKSKTNFSSTSCHTTTTASGDRERLTQCFIEGKSSDENKTVNKATTKEQTPRHDGDSSESPKLSPNTKLAERNCETKQNENRRPGGAFGPFRFGPETTGWVSMGAMCIDPQKRERGGTIMPEPETEERMKELMENGAGNA